MAKKSSGRQDPFVVDFGDTESRGGKKSERSSNVPEGDYLVKCTESRWDKSTEKQTPGVFVTYKIMEPKKYAGKILRDQLWTTDKALWRLRQTLEAAGIEVPSKKVKVDPKKLIGKVVAVTVEDDEYEGKVRSRVSDTFRKKDFESLAAPKDEDDDESEDEEGEEDEDEDEEEDEDSDDDDEDDEDEDEEKDEDLEAVDL